MGDLVRCRLLRPRWWGTGIALLLFGGIVLALPAAGVPVFGDTSRTPPAAAEAATGTLSAADAPVRAVRLIQPGVSTRPTERTFFGRIVARETVDLSFEVRGELIRFPVTEGERIAEGQVLASLDLAPFERAVERGEILLEQADRALARALALVARNVSTRVQAEDAETARDLQDVELREARDDLDDAVIRAPFDGLVATRLTANFSHVEPGQPVVRLHDMSEVHVEIDVPERLFLQVSDPEAVSFFALLPGRPDRVPLRLVEFHAQTDAIGQTYLVVLALPAIDHIGLIPGASVTVIAALATADPAPTVPSSALVVAADRSAQVLVFRETGGTRGTVDAVPVSVVSHIGTELVVDGLPAGAEIVAAGAHLLRPGQVVRRYVGLQAGD